MSGTTMFVYIAGVFAIRMFGGFGLASLIGESEQSLPLLVIGVDLAHLFAVADDGTVLVGPLEDRSFEVLDVGVSGSLQALDEGGGAVADGAVGDDGGVLGESFRQ